MAYILIFDDDEDFANAAATALRREGHEIFTVHSLADGMQSLAVRRPDLLILDLMFPERASGGFDSARSIRRQERFTEMPILMVTAVNEKFPFGFSARDIREDRLPVTDFLEKPVDLGALCGKVAALLAAAKQVVGRDGPCAAFA